MSQLCRHTTRQRFRQPDRASRVVVFARVLVHCVHPVLLLGKIGLCGKELLSLSYQPTPLAGHNAHLLVVKLLVLYNVYKWLKCTVVTTSLACSLLTNKVVCLAVCSYITNYVSSLLPRPSQLSCYSQLGCLMGACVSHFHALFAKGKMYTNPLTL